MKKQKFICKNCGCRFEEEVFEPGEAEEKNRPSYPIICPRCKSRSIEQT